MTAVDKILCVSIIGTLYTSYNIGNIFTMFGIRRELQVIFFAFVLLCGTFSVFRNAKGFFAPLFWSMVLVAGFVAFWQQGLQVAWVGVMLSCLMTAWIILVCYGLPQQLIEVLLKSMVMIIAVYSVMGLVEFALVVLHPSVVPELMIVPGGVPGRAYSHFTSPISYLGFGTGDYISAFGIQVTRLRSFLSEPSLLAGYFFPLAGVGMLLPHKRYRICGIAILLFCLASFSGSVWLTVAIALIYYTFSGLMGKKALYSLLPFFLLLFFYIILVVAFSLLISHANLAQAVNVSALNKTRSMTVRFGAIADYVQILFAYPIGYPEAVTLPLGLILKVQSLGGYIPAFLVSMGVFFYYERLRGFAILKRGLLERLGLGVLYASMLTSMMFLNFFSMYYIVFIVLFTRWTRSYNREETIGVGHQQNSAAIEHFEQVR